jgi:putative sterol carrier protein
MLHYWEEFQSLATKWQKMNRLCAWVEDKCLNRFKNIMKKKRSSINFGQIFDFSFSKETEASY